MARGLGLPDYPDTAQTWYWMEGWQAMELEVDEAVAAGGVELFDDAESFLASLDE